MTRYCSGGELFEKIQELKNFSEKMAAECLRQILGAINYCHEQGIVHRDLKPENLLYDSKLPNAQLKVVDFGVSAKYKKGQVLKDKFGTPYYIAPEVLSRKYDEKCDIWSCGVILYILLCGYPPFNASTDVEIMNVVKKGQYAFDDAEWRNISKDAKLLINKMLTYDPKKRISAAEALKDPWIVSNSHNNPISSNVLKNFSAFNVNGGLIPRIRTSCVPQCLVT